MSNPKHSRDCPRCNTPRYRRPSGVVDCVNDCRERGLISLETPILLRSKISQSSKTALGQHGADGMPPLRGPAAPQPAKIAQAVPVDWQALAISRYERMEEQRLELERVKQQRDKLSALVLEAKTYGIKWDWTLRAGNELAAIANAEGSAQ